VWLAADAESGKFIVGRWSGSVVCCGFLAA